MNYKKTLLNSSGIAMIIGAIAAILADILDDVSYSIN